MSESTGSVSRAHPVIERIVARNNALWSLLTDHTLTREQQLERVEQAFGTSPLVRHGSSSMSEQEKELLARIVEMLLKDLHQPMLAKSGLLNAAYNADIAERLPDFQIHKSQPSPVSTPEGSK